MNENESQNQNDNNAQSDSKSSSLMSTILKNKKLIIPLVLIFGLIITVAYFKIQISTIESNFIIEKNAYQEQFKQKEETLINKFETSMDSINQTNTLRLSTVFSWSIRAELLRENKEQVSLLINQFIKTAGIKEISLIAPLDYKILISTNKKVEGEQFAETDLLISINPKIENNRSILPIFGLNETIGFLAVEYELISNEQTHF